MSSAGAAPRAAVPCQQCARRGEPEERREVARAEDRGRQGARRAECAQARHARAEVCRAAGRGCRRVRRPPGGAGRGAGAGGGAADACSRGGSRSPPGVSRGPIGSRPSCSRSAESRSGGLGLALIRDGNGARSFETLLRYRGAAMAEFWRALRTLKALQAEQAIEEPMLRCAGAPAPADGAAAARPTSATERTRARRRTPAGLRAGRAARARRTLHEPAAPWLPNEPESATDRRRAHLNQLPSSMEPATGLSARPTSDPRTSRRS